MDSDVLVGTPVIVTRDEGGPLGPDGRLGGLYRDHAVTLARYIFRCGVASDEVDDVVADVFAVAWRKIETVPLAPADRLWLLGVARNMVAKHQEGRWRRGRLAERLASSARPQAGITASDDAALRDAIRRLAPKDRDVVRLVLWEGLTHDEAGAVLGCSAGASRLRLHRAAAKLRAIVEADERDV